MSDPDQGGIEPSSSISRNRVVLDLDTEDVIAARRSASERRRTPRFMSAQPSPDLTADLISAGADPQAAATIPASALPRSASSPVAPYGLIRPNSRNALLGLLWPNRGLRLVVSLATKPDQVSVKMTRFWR